MVDIDHFKSINDRYGHLVGDQVIHRVALTLRNAVPEGGLVCRYGGEEFCVLLGGIEARRRTSLPRAAQADRDHLRAGGDPGGGRAHHRELRGGLPGARGRPRWPR